MIELREGFSFQPYQLKISDINSRTNPREFWHLIYQECLVPTPSCSVCERVISDMEDWIAFTCTCSKQYHRNCLHEHIQNFQCPECHASNKVHNPVNFLEKYMSASVSGGGVNGGGMSGGGVSGDVMNQMYNLMVTTNSNPLIGERNDGADDVSASELELFIHKMWWAFTTRPSPLLELHKFLVPFSPHSSVKYMTDVFDQESHNLLCFDPAYVTDENSISFDKKKAEYTGKVVFVEIDMFKKRLEEFSYQLIDNGFPFKAGEIVLFGGAVHKCLESRISLEKMPKYSNLDILICHPNVNELTKNIKRVMKYFKDRFGEDIYWVKRSQKEMLMFFSGYNRSVSLWCCKNTLESVINSVDFSHLQYCYDGSKVWSTHSGIEYAQTLVSLYLSVDSRRSRERIQKCRDLELMVISPFLGLRQSYPREMTIGSWYPLYKENLTHVHAEIHTNYGVRHRSVFVGKPPRIMFSKIPEHLVDPQMMISF